MNNNEHHLPPTGKVASIGLRWVTEGLGAPMSLAPIPEGSDRLLLPDQSSVVHRFDRDRKCADQLFLDLRPRRVAINPGMEERRWSLGKAADGELYVLANGMNSAFGMRGKLFKLVPE